MQSHRSRSTHRNTVEILPRMCWDVLIWLSAICLKRWAMKSGGGGGGWANLERAPAGQGNGGRKWGSKGSEAEATKGKVEWSLIFSISAGGSIDRGAYVMGSGRFGPLLMQNLSACTLPNDALTLNVRTICYRGHRLSLSLSLVLHLAVCFYSLFDKSGLVNIRYSFRSSLTYPRHFQTSLCLSHNLRHEERKIKINKSESDNTSCWYK